MGLVLIKPTLKITYPHLEGACPGWNAPRRSAEKANDMKNHSEDNGFSNELLSG